MFLRPFDPALLNLLRALLTDRAVGPPFGEMLCLPLFDRSIHLINRNGGNRI